MEEGDLVVLMHNSFGSPSILTLEEARKKSKLEVNTRDRTCVLTRPGEYTPSADKSHKLEIGEMWCPDLSRSYGGPIPVAIYDRTDIGHLHNLMYAERSLTGSRRGTGEQLGDL